MCGQAGKVLPQNSHQFSFGQYFLAGYCFSLQTWQRYCMNIKPNCAWKRLHQSSICMQPWENKGLARSWNDIVGFGKHHRVRRWEKQKDNKHPNDDNPDGSLGFHFCYLQETRIINTSLLLLYIYSLNRTTLSTKKKKKKDSIVYSIQVNSMEVKHVILIRFFLNTK